MNVLQALEHQLGVEVKCSTVRGDEMIITMADVVDLRHLMKSRRTIKLDGIDGYVKPNGRIHVRGYLGQEVVIPF